MTGGSGALYWSSDRVTLANYNATGVVNIEANGGTSVAVFGGATYNSDFVGTGRFTGALTGTSASFSSTATATAFIPSGATIPSNGMYLSAANTLDFATNTTNRLSIASTGAATFSNIVNISKSSNSDYLALKIENIPITASNTSSGYIGFYSNPGNGSDNTISTSRIYGKFDSNSYGAARLTFSSVTGFDTYQDAMSIKAGNVGIGTYSPAYQLQLSTDSAGKPNGGSWANSSDIRLKENVKTIDNALEKIMQLRGVTFDWKDETEQDNIKSSAGFIADEVMLSFPNWVKEHNASDKQKELINDDKVKSLSLPFEFDAMLVEAIKELSKQNEELSNRLIKLESK
jgi:hypothetical protein